MHLLINHEHRLDRASWLPSAHCDLRPNGLQPELIVVHCVSLPEGDYGTGAAQRLFTGELDYAEHPSFSDLQGLRVAPHVLIDRKGQMEQFVSFDKRAWHAGISDWRGRSGCNDFSIGVELEGSVLDDYTAPQYRTLIQLVIALMGAYPRISTDALVGHCEIAPGRKTDPGPKFDWPRVVGQVYQHLGA